MSETDPTVGKGADISVEQFFVGIPWTQLTVVPTPSSMELVEKFLARQGPIEPADNPDGNVPLQGGSTMIWQGDTLIMFRRDTEHAWEMNDPVLRPRELCIVTDKPGAKLGDGVTVYSALPFLTGDEVLQALAEGIKLWVAYP